LYHIFEMQKKENFQFYLKDVIVWTRLGFVLGWKAKGKVIPVPN
jgi:hypothetical protein